MTPSISGTCDIAIEDLYGRYRHALTAFFRRRCHNPAEVEDMTQEVFLRVIRREEAVPVGNLDGYIFQIAANLLRDGARRAVTRHARLHIDYESGLDGADDEEMVDILDPHRIAEARDTLSHSLRALSELGERTRDIFVLSRVEKLKHKEIAEMLGVSVSAVEKHLVKAFTHIALCKRSLRG